MMKQTLTVFKLAGSFRACFEMIQAYSEVRHENQAHQICPLGQNSSNDWTCIYIFAYLVTVTSRDEGRITHCLSGSEIFASFPT